MKQSPKILLLALLISFSLIASQIGRADDLQLRDGRLIQGQYMGGTKASINFLVNGTIQNYPVTKIMILDFSRPASSSSAGTVRTTRPQTVKSSTQYSQAAASTSSDVTVPVGTQIEVRMIDTVDSQVDQVGHKFQASLEQPLVSGGKQLAPKGATAYGQLIQSRQAGRLTGSSELRLELTGLQVNGKVLPISTSDYTVAGKSRGKQTAERTGIGAGVGALAGGGKGAAIGAGIGGGAGAVSQIITRGQDVHVPSETVLDFSLAQPLTIAIPARPAQ